MEAERVSKMGEDHTSGLKSPVTYGDVLDATDELGSDAVMPEDAAFMQSAEARTFGKTRKDGAAPVMHAVAEENVKAGFMKEGDRSHGSKVLYKRSEDIETGDRMWAQAEEKDTTAAVYVVKRIDTVVKQGVYNPFTLGGTIIVNSVVASTTSFLGGENDET